jgi:hypothetical protein
LPFERNLQRYTSARSGHRMVTHPSGKSILLFGGFYDTGAEIRYYNDVWELVMVGGCTS